MINLLIYKQYSIHYMILLKNNNKIFKKINYFKKIFIEVIILIKNKYFNFKIMIQ